MSRVVHVQTVITTTFGLLDEEGNVIPQQPIQVQVSRFAADAFEEAHRLIEKAREEASSRSPADSMT
jgi:hypothetical protein